MIVTVFDFDDTLHATTYVHNYAFLLKDETHLKLPELSDSIISLLSIARSISDVVYIITNSEDGWIDLCAQRHLPNCEEFLKQFPIIYRDPEISKTYPFQQWKSQNFLKLAKHFSDKGETHHLIAFGDLPYDRMASMTIKALFPHVLVKNVMLASSPSVQFLIEQHNVIRNFMFYLARSNNHLDTVIKIGYTESTTQKSLSSSALDELTSAESIFRKCKDEGDVIETESKEVLSSTSDSDSDSDVFPFDP